MPFNPEKYRTQVNVGKVGIWTRNKNCDIDPENQTIFPGDGTLWTWPSGGPTGGGAGAYTEIFKDTALNYFIQFGGDFGPILTNSYRLINLVQQIFQDYTAWRQLSFDEVFDGVIAAVPNGLIDESIIDYNGLEAITRILTYPPTFGFQEFGHFDWQGDCSGTALPCHYYYGPPALCCTTTSTQIGPSGETAMVTATQMYITQMKICLEDGRLVSRFVQYVPLCHCPGPCALPAGLFAVNEFGNYVSIDYKGGI
jgi:hypothetical protein